MQNKNIIYEDEYAIVYYWPDKKIIENKWKKEAILNEATYHKPFIKAIEFAKKNTVYYFISDVRLEGVVPYKEKKWFKEFTIHAAIEKNVKLAAVISNYNIFKTYYVNAIIKFGNNMGFPIKIFNKYSKALKWIESYKNKTNN